MNWAACVACWPLPGRLPHPGSGWADGVWQPELVQSLQPTYGGMPGQGCALSCLWLCPSCILGLFHPRMRFKAESRLCLPWAVVLHSPLALCFGSCFQPFYTDHRRNYWVFLLPGQVWPTTSTGAGIKGAYGSTWEEGQGKGSAPVWGSTFPNLPLLLPKLLLQGWWNPGLCNPPCGYTLQMSLRKRTYQ